MSIEPLPLGSFGDFSITVDAPLASLWPTPPPSPPPLQDDHLQSSHQGVQEVRQRQSLDAAAPEQETGLAATVAELETVRSQVRTKEHNIAALTDLIRRATEERDLLRHHNTLLLAHKLQAVPSSCTDEAGPSSPSAMFMPFAGSSPADAAVIDGPAMFNPTSAAGAALRMPSPADVVATEDIPSFAAMDGGDMRAAAAALQVPSFAAMDSEDMSAAVAALQMPNPAALNRGSGHSPLPSSPFSFPFPVPSPAAAVAMDRSTAEVPSSAAAVVENRSKLVAAAARLDVLAGKRPLPHKGQLLQAVMDAGPLLQNLMVAGPMPRWRNPPPALTNTILSAPPSGSGAPMGSPWPTHSPSGSAPAPIGSPWLTHAPSGSAPAPMGSPWPTHSPPGSAGAPMGSPWLIHSPSGSGAPMGSPWPTYSPSGSGAPMG